MHVEVDGLYIHFPGFDLREVQMPPMMPKQRIAEDLRGADIPLLGSSLVPSTSSIMPTMPLMGCESS